jgi:cell division transport system ATP-binding protein
MTDRGENTPIIRLANVHHAYGNQRALSDLSFEILKNELVFVSGPSGAGKTTLLKLLYRGERSTSGEIQVDGTRLHDLAPRRLPLLRRRLGIIFQDYKLIAGRSVHDNVALVLEAAGHRQELIPRKVRAVLHMVGMEHHAAALPPRLSGGEQQRVAVARALVGDPRIILADEPTGNLDDASARAVVELLRAAYIRGATVIIATHDKSIMHSLGGRVLYLDQGRLAGAGRIEKGYDRSPR